MLPARLTYADATAELWTELRHLPAAVDVIGRSAWAQQNQPISGWPQTCTIQVRSEDTQMWVVWSLGALIGFCLVLSFFETAPAEARSRSRRKP